MSSPVPEMETFQAALRGETADLGGADTVVCVAPEFGSVFLVRPKDDGTQEAIVFVATEYGGGTYDVDLPPGFRVTGIDHDAEAYTVTGADGTTVRATPRQFTLHPRILDREVNPDHDAQRLEAFLATGTFPEDGGDYLEVTAGGEEISLLHDCAGPEKVAELEPHVRALLADLDGLRATALDFMWNRSLDGTETEADRTHYHAAFTPHTLVVLRSGDFELHVGENEGEEFYFLDGYWPAIHFRADRTPVDVVVEA